MTVCTHFWEPKPVPGVVVSDWDWFCTWCKETSHSAPTGVTSRIKLRDLEALVDSSLRIADRVMSDDQSVKGELWLMRHANWTYLPFSFNIVYHVLQGEVFVVLFTYEAKVPGKVPKPIPDTDTYRKLIVAADNWRRVQP